MSDSLVKKISFSQKYQFWLFLVAAIILRQIPIISLPFNWLESYFHEISHGLAALLSGGKIIQIQLFSNGAGLCTTQGGIRFLVSFFGYGGAIIWGALIYSLAKFHQRGAQILAAFIVLLLVLSILLWARDPLTIIICAVLIVLFVFAIKVKDLRSVQWLIQLSGMMVLLNGLYSPFYLIDGRSLGDGATLSSLTGIPEILWVIIWSLMGISSLFLLAKKR